MRERARTAVRDLARLARARRIGRRVLTARATARSSEIQPGMTILLAAGERVPVDARVVEGRSRPRCLAGHRAKACRERSAQATLLQAGTLNLTGPLTIVATAAARESFLAEMMRLMERAEAGRAGYRRIADRAARLYAPVVHRHRAS